MSLGPAERSWLEVEAQETLGLTAARTRVLAAVLRRDGPFSMRGIGRETGQSAENVRLALELMVARELLELKTLADPHRPKASFLAEPGRRLRMVLAALPDSPEPSQSPSPQPAQNT